MFIVFFCDVHLHFKSIFYTKKKPMLYPTHSLRTVFSIKWAHNKHADWYGIENDTLHQFQAIQVMRYLLRLSIYLKLLLFSIIMEKKRSKFFFVSCFSVMATFIIENNSIWLCADVKVKIMMGKAIHWNMHPYHVKFDVEAARSVAS